MTFWCIGRRKLKMITRNSSYKNTTNSANEQTNVSDFFVCFRDNTDNLLIELAFNNENFLI
jgi:hypothetical protein